MNFVAPFTPAVYAIANAISQMAYGWGLGDVRIGLMKNNPNIDAGLTMATIVPADFEGYTAKGVDAASSLYSDPDTGQLMIRLIPPAGGFFWFCDGVGGLPQTVYGVYATDTDDVKLLGAAKFSTPKVLTASDQFIAVGELLLPVSMTPLG